jgi:Uma2 family endonuclease
LPYDEGRQWELIQGELIAVSSPTPEHQLIVGMLIASLREYFRRKPVGNAIAAVEFALGVDERFRPDVAVLLVERWKMVDRKKTPIPGAPDIAVEVMSPNERATDSLRKIWTYLGAGVHKVWQVSPETRKVLVYRSAKSISALDIDEFLTTPLRELFET